MGKFIPGRCGISDYVTRLSQELNNLGHVCRIINMDSNTGKTFVSIADKLPEFDLMSIQFSPYSFSKDGLSGNDLKWFGAEIKNRHVQVIFHEIWIGDHKGSSVAHKFRGWRQRKEITGFIKLAEPIEVYSTNAASIHRLQKFGIKARYLYLFGNVPHCRTTMEPNINSKQLSAIFFGTLYDSFPLERAIERLREIARDGKRKLKVRVMGRQREQKGIQRLRRLFMDQENAFEELGEVSLAKASHNLQTADFGVSTTPFDAIGKSGATAAMLEHGLPVVAYDDGDTPEDALFAPGPFGKRLLLLDQPDFSVRLQELVGSQKQPFFDGVAHTAKSFLRSLPSTE